MNWRRWLLCSWLGHDVRVTFGPDRFGIAATPFRCRRCKTLFEDVSGRWIYKP